jgi:hypothetical protein
VSPELAAALDELEEALARERPLLHEHWPSGEGTLDGLLERWRAVRRDGGFDEQLSRGLYSLAREWDRGRSEMLLRREAPLVAHAIGSVMTTPDARHAVLRAGPDGHVIRTRELRQAANRPVMRADDLASGDSASERPTDASAQPRPKRKARRALEVAGWIIIGIPIAVIAGALVGYIGGLIAAFLWSTPRQPPQDLESVREWGTLIGAIGLPVLVLGTVIASPLLERRRKRIAEERTRHYRAWKRAGYEADEIPEFEEPAISRLLQRANNWAAVVTVIAAVLVLDVHDHFIGHRYLAFLAVLVAMPWLAYLAIQPDKRNDFEKSWVIAGAVLLLIFAARSTSDAFFHEYANCWTVRTSGDSEIVDCAPGSEPLQGLPGYDRWSDTETPGRECTFLDQIGSVRRWECHEI